MAMAVVGFAVLFAGILSPPAATGSTAALLLFVLPVAVAQPASSVGPRLVGWVVASIFSIPACMLIWPTPWHDELRRRLSATVAAVAAVVCAQAEGREDLEAQGVVKTELSRLRDQFAGTPYPPTGAAAGAVAVAKLVGRVEWVADNTTAAVVQTLPPEPSAVLPLLLSACETLRMSASLICDGNAHPVSDPVLIRSLQESTRRLDELVTSVLDAEVSTLIDAESDTDVMIEAGPPNATRLHRQLVGSELSGPCPRDRHRHGGRRGPRGRGRPRGRRPAIGRHRCSCRPVCSGGGSSRISRSVRCGSAMRCAERSGWPWPSPSWR